MKVVIWRVYQAKYSEQNKETAAKNVCAIMNSRNPNILGILAITMIINLCSLYTLLETAAMIYIKHITLSVWQVIFSKQKRNNS